MKTTLHRIIFLLFTLLLILTCLFFASPFIIDTYVIPGLIDNITPLEKSATISRLTPFSVRGAFRFEHEGYPVISIPYIEISYSPGFLFSRKLSSLRLDHATIHITRSEGKYSLVGFSASEQDTVPSGSSFSLPILPVTLDTLDVKECSIVIHEKGKNDIRLTLSSKFDLTFTEEPNRAHRLHSIAGSFYLFDTISGKGNISLIFGQKKHVAALSIETATLPTAGFLSSHPDFDLTTGAVRAKASCSIDAETFSLFDIKAEGLVNKFQGSSSAIKITGTGENNAVPFSLSGSLNKLEYAIGPAAISRPLLLEVGLSGAGIINHDGFKTDGIVRTILTDTSLLTDANLHIPVSYNGSFAFGRGWQTSFSARSDKNIFTTENTFTSSIPAFTLEGGFQGDGSKIEGTAVLNAEPFSITKNETELSFSDLVLQTTFLKEADRTTAVISADIPHISFPSQGVTLTGTQLKLPIKYPFSGDGGKNVGSFLIKSIHLNDTPLATFFSTISQHQQTFNFSGSLRSDYLEESELIFDGNAEPFSKSASLSWHMNKSTITSSHLPPFLKIPEGIDFNGVIATNGKLSLLANRFTGEMQTTINDGSLNITEKDGSIEGINCSLELPRLPEIASSPGQQCTIDSIDFGNMHFSDARIHFRIDDPETVFIEKGKVQWCSGLVESTSLKFSTSDKEIDTTLYCSRINFADLLNQFGLDQADGEGTVNGKLPIQFSKKGLHFDDGFLFSTPGTGGIVKFSNTEMLRQGIGAVNAGGYLDYSMKAMEDFSYNWTKLSFNSSGDELLLAMQLDGKPRTPLPYKFKNGMIVETAQEDGLQYPIRLDVNFRLPLADLFQIGQNIQTLKENM